MRATRRRLSPLLLLAIALGLLLLSGPSVDAEGPSVAGAKVSFGLSGTGDASISVPLPETVEWQQFQARAGLEARVTDPEARTRANVIPTADVTWKWYRGNTLVRTITNLDGTVKDANERTYSPVQPADVGHRITVEATYRVRASYDSDDANYHVFLGPEKTVRYTSVNPVQRWRHPTRNRLPAFAGAGITRLEREDHIYRAPTIRVHENTRGNIGGPHPATDPDGDRVTYTVRGDDASIRFGVPRFLIDNATGQLRLAPGANLNYEDRTSYEVQIRAYDSSANNTGAETDPQVTVEARVRIQVVDVDEPPSWGAGVPDGEIIAQTEGRTAIDLDNDRTATPDDLATFVASDPEGTNVTLSLRGPDAGAFRLTAATDADGNAVDVLSFRHATDFDQPADSNGDNVYEVTVRASDEIRRTDPSYSASWWNAERTLRIRVVGRSTLDEWTPTLRPKSLGDGRLGCHNGVSGARCAAALTPDRFTVTRMSDGQLSSTVHIVEELYLTQQGELVLTMGPFVPRGFTLSTTLPGTGPAAPATESKFSIGLGTSHQARWRNTGLEWSAGRGVELSMDRPRATLSSPAIRVHYDGDPVVDGFRQWQPARLAAYGYGVRLPGVFSYLDPNNDEKFAHTTHAKVAVFPEFQGSTVRVGKITYSATDDTDATEDPPVVCTPYQGLGVVQSGSREVTSVKYKCVAFGAVAFAQLSHAIELNAHLPNTGVYIEVTDGSVVNTYFLDIDPPPRTYSLSPSASVVEGQDARLTLSLSQPAPEAGLAFTVTAAYGTAGSTDVGTITSPVTVPGGATRLNIAVPTVDDDLDEDDETFTVTVAPVRAGWAVSSDATGTATVTIADNDEAPPTPTPTPEPTQPEPTPPEGTEPWDIQVVPGDGSLTVSWRVNPRDGVADGDIRHALRWSQAPGVWNNPRDPKNVGSNDGITVAGGVTSYLITGLKNDVATGVFVRSYTGGRHDEQSPQSSQWVRVKGEHTTPRGDGQQQQATPNNAPTVDAAIGDATIVHETGTHQVSLSGTFSDADNDSLTISAASSNNGVATASVSADQSTLTVTAKSRGTATITVTANDGNGGSVSDSFDVRVKAAPAVASAISNLSGLTAGTTRDVSLSGVFTDADGDTLTISAGSSNDATATVSVAADYSKLTVAGVAQGAATITVIAEDSDGNRVQDVFSVSAVTAPEPEPTNNSPTVATAIGDATIINESGTKQVSLSGAFSDADNDSLTISASSSNTAVATVSVAADYASLTVTAKSRGTATITVTASDGNGGTASDSFTVRVKAAPVVASAIGDVSGLAARTTRDVSLSGVFSDADGDTLTVTAASADDAKATVTVASDGSKLTVGGVAQGRATITVTAQDSDGNTVSDQFSVTVGAPANNAPTVSGAIGDATIVNESGTQAVSLSGVFDDADNDSLTITAVSSDDGVATVSVSGGGSSLTVSAQSRGTATITVTANDGRGGSVSDSFDVRVKAAPVVASAIGDVSGLAAGTTREVSLSGVFTDADGDTLTVTAASSDDATATVSVAADYSTLTVEGAAEGEATITVTARDSDGNTVSDTFQVEVVKAPAPEEEETPEGAPLVVSPLPDITFEGRGHREISLAGVFQDPEGQELTYSVESSDYGVVRAWKSGDSHLALLVLGNGTVTVTVTARDPDGNTVSHSFQVTPAS